MREVFAEHRPTVVFHAAAYKHVGLMEDNPVEAVRNNALATRIVAHIAGESGADRSCWSPPTRRCRPATVMGASKALAEWAVEAARRAPPAARATPPCASATCSGSSGSVVPIFRRQIAAGGPVTVTDERMTRYFMTIPEAVQLIIRSGSLGDGGEVFVLEMGEPVRDRRPGPRHDPPVRPRARHATSRSRSSAAAPARSSTRSCSTPTSARRRRRPRRSSGRARAARPRRGWRARSTRSTCSFSKGTPPPSPLRSTSCRPPGQRPALRVPT